MKTLIIDNESNQRNVLRELLSKYCPCLTVSGEAESISTAQQLIEDKQPSLLFIDVEMPNDSGLDLFKLFKHFPFEVIFVTEFGRYSIQAFEFNTLQIIHRPFNELKLIAAVEKARARLDEKQRDAYNQMILENLKRPVEDSLNNQIAIPVFEGLEFVRVKDIVRCASDAGNTSVYLTSGKRIYSTKNLKQYQRILKPYSFFRTHNSHLVNISHIKKYLKQDGGTIAMSDGVFVPVSARKKNDFLRAMEDF